uniref:Uncharacterized protein n=1 Tax=Pseudomonas phage Cygsa01 TaxID=3138529 RepID=A0AAU6W5H4_9VIRU
MKSSNVKQYVESLVAGSNKEPKVSNTVRLSGSVDRGLNLLVEKLGATKSKIMADFMELALRDALTVYADTFTGQEREDILKEFEEAMKPKE